VVVVLVVVAVVAAVVPISNVLVNGIEPITKFDARAENLLLDIGNRCWMSVSDDPVLSLAV